MQLEDGLLEPPPHLTQRQAEVLGFIWTFFRSEEVYPTHREIASGIGASSTNAAPWLDALVRKGVLARKRNIGVRNIRLTAEGIRALKKSGVINPSEQLEL